ncbi:MAG TPA: TatD family hydrolase [Candidatus Binataceae bacterium]
MIDSHIHLDADQYADPSGAIKRARAAGIEAIVAPGTGPGSNQRVIELARANRGYVFAAGGFHPERFELTDADLDATVELIRRERDSICAIGEIGMPWYGERAKEPGIRARAQTVLQRFARLAVELNLPVIIHAPHDSARDALAIVCAAGVRRAVFHWQKSDDATTHAIIDAGYFISLTPEVVYRERDQKLARKVPLGLMMVETDGPWPHGGPFEGRPTEPAMIVDTVEAIARVLGVRRELVGAITATNARNLFRLARF